MSGLRMLPDVPKDPISGKKPTHTQLKVVLLLNPIGEHPRTHEGVANVLGITLSAVTSTMARFKKRCPTYYSRFVEVKRTIGKEQNKTLWDEMNHRLLSLDSIASKFDESEQATYSDNEQLDNFLHDHLKEKF